MAVSNGLENGQGQGQELNGVSAAADGDHGVRMRNSSEKPWLVQKFGGTSIGKFPSQIAEHVVKPYLAHHRLVLVCSARSTDTKVKGTTNRLLKAAEAALYGDSKFLAFIEAVRQDHLQTANSLVSNSSILKLLLQQIDKECNKLSTFLSAIQTIEEISPRSKDAIIGSGEKLACLFMTALLNDRGVDATYINLEGIIPITYVAKHGLDQSFYTFLTNSLRTEILNCGTSVPVVSGYFGIVPGSLLSAIGRGYTDLCAALLAVGVGAEELQIWKEIDGIFTADPRKVPTARLIPSITPEEAAELTYYGSEVIHPFTCEQVMRARIPIRIKNVGNPNAHGTIIFPDNVSRPGMETPPHPPKISAHPQLSLRPRAPTAVTTKSKIMIVNVHSNRKRLSHGFFAGIFGTLDDRKLAVDLISTSEVHVSMAIHAQVREHDLKEAIEELRKFGTVDVVHNMTILSLVGKHMKNMVGIAGRMFSTLAACDVNIEMISQGANEINISCVIDEKDAVKAMSVLHHDLLSNVDMVI